MMTSMSKAISIILIYMIILFISDFRSNLLNYVENYLSCLCFPGLYQNLHGLQSSTKGTFLGTVLLLCIFFGIL